MTLRRFWKNVHVKEDESGEWPSQVLSQSGCFRAQ